MQRRTLAILPLIPGLMLLAGTAVHPRAADTAAAAAGPDRVARGEYLVRAGLCHDCHTPHRMGQNGPEPDMSRALSGHPAGLVLPPPPALAAPWVMAAAETNTAWAGPWGISYTANLTPDEETGLGRWTEEMFMMALRTGRHEGRGRPILPPMPYKFVGSMTDEDLRALFAYLRSLPAVRNRVPAPVDPPEETGR